MNFIRHLVSLIQFLQLPQESRRIVFYSVGKNYWVHLDGFVMDILQSSNLSVCYISSDSDDPGLHLKHDRMHAFKIDEGWIRNWLFENIETDVFVMTMPDLENFQIKRSRYKVHYVYVQHALISLHMAYREHAFDHFDTVFCSGPHHVKEIRAIEDSLIKSLTAMYHGRIKYPEPRTA